MTLPASGPISLNNVRAEILQGSSTISLNDAPVRKLAVKETAGSQIAMSDLYGKTYINYPFFNLQSWSIGTVYPFGGCAGAGFRDAVVTFGSNHGVSVRVNGWFSDYGDYRIDNGLNKQNYYCGNPTEIFYANGCPVSSVTCGTQAYFAAGRDAPIFQARTTWDGSIFNLQIWADCKGGANRWTNLFLNVKPVYTMKTTPAFSYVNNPYLNNNGPHNNAEIIVPEPPPDTTGTSPNQGPSCFPAGTPVIMADGTTKMIEDVRIGDFVMGAFGESNVILAYDRTILGHRPMYLINQEHRTTDTHTHITDRNTLASLINDSFGLTGKEQSLDFCTIQDIQVDEIGTIERIMHPGLPPEDVELLEEIKIGTVLKTIDGYRDVKSIQQYTMPYDTILYNFIVGGSHTYFVDRYAVTGFANGRDFDYRTWTNKQPSWTLDDYRNFKI